MCGRPLAGRRPEIAITLGSGLGDLAERLDAPLTIPYKEIPHFPGFHCLGT